jgi:hypothetical protein
LADTLDQIKRSLRGCLVAAGEVWRELEKLALDEPQI